MTVERALVLGRAATVVLLAVVLQVGAAPVVSLLSVHPELPLLLAVAAGVSIGPDRGAVVGFALGLGYDLFLQTPFGMTALVYAAVAYGCGSVQRHMAGQRRRSRMLLVGGGTAAGVVGWVLVGRLLDAAAPPVPTVVRVALVAGAVNALLAGPATRLWDWVVSPAAPQRVPV
jgi:rod shape-determining protein MreD